MVIKKVSVLWWCHQMKTFSALLALSVGNSLVTGEFFSQRPVMRSFDVFFDQCLNQRLSKQSRRWWFETPSCSLWCHCNDNDPDSSSSWSSKGRCINFDSGNGPLPDGTNPLPEPIVLSQKKNRTLTCCSPNQWSNECLFQHFLFYNFWNVWTINMYPNNLMLKFLKFPHNWIYIQRIWCHNF